MTDTKALRAKLGDDIAKYHSVTWLEDGEPAFRSLLEGRRYRTVIETGTFCGVSACVLADYADHVHTFDIQVQDLAADVISEAGYNMKITRHHVGNADKHSIIRALIAKGDVDLAFIDGDHNNDGPMIDIIACSGIPILIFDNYQEDAAYDAVRNAVDSIPTLSKTRVQNIIKVEVAYD